MAKQRALGRGLSSLIPSGETDPLPAIPRELDLDRLKPNPDQPRGRFNDESLESLTRSIRLHGVLQPLLVRPDGGGYRIVAGERRWRGARLAGLDRVPVHVLPEGEGRDLELALLENIQREDLSPLEVAEGLEKLAARPGMTQQKIADAMGWSRAAVTNKLRLLHLPEEVRLLLAEGSLSEGHCRALLGAENAETQIEIARRAAETGASVRQVEQWVRRTGLPSPGKEQAASGPLHQRCEVLSRRLGIRLRISGTARSRRLTLSSVDDSSLWELLDLLEERSGELFPGK